jgi:hypothetical protein
VILQNLCGAFCLRQFRAPSRPIPRRFATLEELEVIQSSSNSISILPPFLTSIVSDKMQAFSRCARPAFQAAVRRQGYSTSTSAYAATAENLRINKETRVIYQGFTGKQGT